MFFLLFFILLIFFLHSSILPSSLSFLFLLLLYYTTPFPPIYHLIIHSLPFFTLISFHVTVLLLILSLLSITFSSSSRLPPAAFSPVNFPNVPPVNQRRLPNPRSPQRRPTPANEIRRQVEKRDSLNLKKTEKINTDKLRVSYN